jgi:D-cysteine desulfhydrase
LKAWDEICAQVESEPALKDGFDSVIVAHGSGGTHAGLVLGKILRNNPRHNRTRIIGVNVCYDKKRSFDLTKDILWSAIQQFHLPLSFFAEDIEVLDGYVGKGYAQNTPEELQAMAQVARAEGVILDPTYTGKAFLGMLDTIRKQKDYFGRRILFIHTGGGFGNFKLHKEWSEVLK